MSLKKPILVIVSSIIVTTVISTTATARSVFVIADTGNLETDIPIIQAYRIQDSNLVYQTYYNCVHPLAIGIAIDTDSEFLFVTHEEYQQYPGNVIELINAKTMRYVDTVETTGASNLAGIVVDQGKQKVYVVHRETNILYVYLWNPVAKTLTLEGGTYKSLDYGMAMGESFFPSIEAKQAQPELTAADIEEILKWLEELWLTDDEVRKMISEDEWLKFMEAVIQALKEQIYN